MTNNIHNINIHLVFILCCLGYLAPDFGFDNNSTWQRVVYMFCSANILHAVLNIISYLLLVRYVKGTILQYTPFLCGVLATIGTGMDLPTIGLSGVCYAMSATCFVYFKDVRLKILLILMIANVVGYFIGMMNIGVHIMSFIYSLIISLIYKSCTQKKQQNNG